MKDIHIKVPDKLHESFKAACKKEEMVMTTVLQRLMEKFVSETTKNEKD